jgi:hypothetical protein
MRVKWCKANAGMTLVEVMVSTGIILVSVLGILYSYVKAIEMNSIGQGAGIAIRGVKDKVEEIKAYTFAQIPAHFNNMKFTITGLNGRGVIYVKSPLISTHLVEVKVVFCWRLAGGRVVGEDRDLNGVLDAGEDANGNGQLDSYVQIVTQVYG